MKQDFEKVEQRAAALRLTVNELIEQHVPDMSYVTYWRAVTAETSLKTQIKVIRRVEEVLDKLEAERTNA